MSVPIRVKRIRPGDDVETYCGRCKAERTHQVVALKADGAPADVICRTCGGQHRFRPEKKEPSASSASSASPAPRKTTRRAEPLGSAPAGTAKPYSPRETYADGDWLDHPKFGQGRVTQARSGKIEVRFESGPRVLLHAG